MIRYDDTTRGQTLTPYIVVKDADRMIDFYQQGLGAEVVEVHRVPGSDRVMHASLRIGGSMFYINDEFPNQGSVAPVTNGATSSTIHIQVSEGLDELYRQAVEAGAKGIMEPADQFWGDRFATISDPSGHQWSMGMAISNPPAMDEECLKEML